MAIYVVEPGDLLITDTPMLVPFSAMYRLWELLVTSDDEQTFLSESAAIENLIRTPVAQLELWIKEGFVRRL